MKNYVDWGWCYSPRQKAEADRFTTFKVCMIFHIIRNQNSIFVLLFLIHNCFTLHSGRIIFLGRAAEYERTRLNAASVISLRSGRQISSEKSRRFVPCQLCHLWNKLRRPKCNTLARAPIRSINLSGSLTQFDESWISLFLRPSPGTLDTLMQERMISLACRKKVLVFFLICGLIGCLFFFWP